MNDPKRDVTRYSAYELVDMQEKSVMHIPAPGAEVVLASDYDALARQLAEAQQVVKAITRMGVL